MTQRTEVVTSDGEFAYPPMKDIGNLSDDDVWVRTEDGDVKNAECTLALYSSRSFTQKQKEYCVKNNADPFEKYR